MSNGSTPCSARVRFAPSPTGYLHIGGARTVLFNWLVARRAGGTFILRIEDTDQQRHVEDSVEKILDDLRWLGLSWDEGPVVGGPCGPYFQSQRLPIYHEHIERLLREGKAYYAMETPQQLEAMRESAKREKRNVTYIRPSPLPTVEEGLAAKRAGAGVVVRLRMPDEDITVVDDILGDVTVKAEQLEDFVIFKSDGFPTYHFACVVDDELMGVTQVLRAQEHLMNTPKHVALQRALGFRTPKYGHMPLIFNIDGTKMSKRDKEKALSKGQTPPEIDVHDFRAAGYLPEAVLNFIALLGWSPGDDREMFTLEELVRAFSVERIGKTNARFDREKLLSFNTQWAARISSVRLLEAFKDFLRVNHVSPVGADDALLERVLRACAGFRTFAHVMNKGGFLLRSDDAVEMDPKAVKKVLEKGDGEGYRTLQAVMPRLDSLSDWNAAGIDTALDGFCKETGVGMGAVAQPIRVAVSGGTISPAIGETLAMLGKRRTLVRLRHCLELQGRSVM